MQHLEEGSHETATDVVPFKENIFLTFDTALRFLYMIRIYLFPMSILKNAHQERY